MPSNASLILPPRTRQITSVGVSPHPSAPPPRSLRLFFLSPVCELHRRRPPAVSPHPCAPSRRSAPPSASCDNTPLEPPPQDARRGPQDAAAPRRSNAAGARHGPATAPGHLPHGASSSRTPAAAYGSVRRPLAQGGTKRPPRSPSEMGAAGMLSFFFIFLLSQFFHMIY